MAICLATQSVFVSPDPNGGGTDIQTFVVVENTAVTPESCGMVALSGAEYAAYTGGPFSLTAEQGAQVGGAILLVWAVAWTIRAVARVITQTDVERN